MKRSRATNKPKRRWWQHALRAGVVGVLVLLLAYATLPWWLPTGPIARWLEGRLSDELGVKVQIDGLWLSWGEGMRISSFRVAGPEGFGDEPMLETGTIRCDFSPLRTLWTGQIAWMTVQSPRLRAVLNDRGELNLACVRNVVLSVQTDRLSIDSAMATLSLPDDPDRFRLDVSHLQVRAGRVFQVGRVNLSASLHQPPDGSPISLIMRESDAPGGAEYLMDLTFSRLDLGRLGLIELLGLPLRRLEGEGGGSLHFKLRKERGLVEDVRVALTVSGLDVQPKSEDYRVPVIGQASLALDARFDPVNDWIDVGSVAIRAPGLELDGSAGFHTSVLASQWQGFRQLQLDGRIDPSAVTALLKGEPEPLAGLARVDGDVGMSVSYSATRDQLAATVSLDATEAALIAGERVIKPRGQTLAGSFSVTCKPKTWHFVADQTELRLGENVFKGQGAMSNIRRLATRWLQTDKPWTGEDLRRAAAELGWAGRWSIRELDCLSRLHPALATALSEAKLDGEITGSWRLAHAAGSSLDLRFVCEAGSSLAVGDVFVKPPGEAMELELRARFDGELRRLEDATLALTYAGSRAVVQLDGLEAEHKADTGALLAQSSGSFYLERAERLVECLPTMRTGESELSGTASGRFVAQFGAGVIRLHADADLTQLAGGRRGWFAKSAGEPLRIEADVIRNREGSPWRLDVAAHMPAADVNFGVVRHGPSQWAGDVDIATRDAAWLMRRAEPLSQFRRQWHVDGSATVHASWELNADGLNGYVKLAGDALGVAGGSPRREKRPGEPLRVLAVGRIGRGEGGAPAVEFSTLAADVGTVSARLAGRMGTGDGAAAGTLELAGQVSLTVDESLVRLAPELDGAVRTFGVTGTLTGRCELNVGADGAKLTGHLNADDFAVDVDGIGGKTAGMPAGFDFEASAPPDWRWLLLNDLWFSVGPLSGIADARIDLRADPSADGAAAPIESHFRLWTDHAEQLAELVPTLATRNLRGQVEILGELTAGPDAAALKYANVRFDDLSLVYNGKRVSLDGPLLIEHADILAVLAAMDDPLKLLDVEVGRVATDGLEIRVGDNAAALVADLRDLPAKANGSVTLLADTINAEELRLWLAGPGGQTSRPAEGFDADYAEQLRRQADDLIALAGSRLRAADVTFTGYIRHLNDFRDTKVDQLYDVSSVSIRGVARRGVASAEYTTGFSGGTMSEAYDIDLNADEPRIVYRGRLDDVMATEALQPQILAFFPGNELLGSMSRRQDVSAPLVDYLAGLLDPRCPVHFAGTGRTEMHQGIVSGRAAPLYVSRVFPGLNLVAYPYDTMVAFAEFEPDGSVANDMIFTGKAYNMYIRGVTDSDQVGDYEVGVLLLAELFGPEQMHQSESGRLAILKWQATIIGGKAIDETVSYPWPNEGVLRFMLYNNPFYLIWAQTQK